MRYGYLVVDRVAFEQLELADGTIERLPPGSGLDWLQEYWTRVTPAHARTDTHVFFNPHWDPTQPPTGPESFGQWKTRVGARIRSRQGWHASINLDGHWRRVEVTFDDDKPDQPIDDLLTVLNQVAADGWRV